MNRRQLPSGRSAADETKAEFLSSSDNWFRPVETRTGPDGALWVVDMYRFVIEHPRWITPERLAKLDTRAGEQQGRLYRVRKLGDTNPPTWGNLTSFGTSKLAELLSRDNGILRDLAHRLLIERADSAAIPLVQATSQQSPNPAVRVQALFVLDQLGGLRDALVLSALSDRDSNVRRAAIQLSETRAKTVKPIADRWMELARTPK